MELTSSNKLLTVEKKNAVEGDVTIVNLVGDA